MKYSLMAAALAVPCTLAAPVVEKRQANIDVTVLQFALTLEHLENVFYKGALQRFTQSDFEKAGYSANYYNNLKYIAADEQSHVDFLTSAIKGAGQTPVAACQYNFPYTDVNSFIGLSSVLEGVGTSAYLGGAPLITSKAYLTAAGSILVTEALHTSYQRNAVNEVPFADPYGTPLDPTSVYTLAAAFIKSCPSSNAALPFKPFPALTLKSTPNTYEEPSTSTGSQGHNGWKRSWSWGWGNQQQNSPSASSQSMAAFKQGATINFAAASNVPAGSYVTFVSGLNVVSVKATGSGTSVSAAIPNNVDGQTYVFVTKTAATGNTLTDASVLFGPSIVEVAPAAPQINYSQQ